MPSNLAAALGSPAMAHLALHYALHPCPPLHGRELERHTGLASQSLQNALDRLVDWGILVRESVGNRVVYHLQEDHPRWKALREMVRAFADPTEVLSEALAAVEGVEAAFVFGSMARGNPRPDSDIDLLVLGDGVSSVELGRAIQDAQLLLNRRIDTKWYTAQKLTQRLQHSGGFLHEALQGPKRWIVGSPHVLEAFGSQGQAGEG